MHFYAASFEGLAVLLLVGLLIAVAAMTLYTVRVLTHPPRRTYASALARNRPGDPGELDRKFKWTAWDLRWRHLDLPVWDIEGEKPEGPIIVLTHGWGDSRIGGLTRVGPLAPLASRLILWDMPGHGEAKGTCSLGTHEVAALLALIERIGKPVVLYGWSLGAGVSIAAEAGVEREPGPRSLADTGVRAVIAEAPYRLPQTPARNVLLSYALPHRINLPLAMRYLGMRLGVGAHWRGFDRAALAAKMQAPLLVIHGAQDLICPVEDGEQIAAAAPRHEITRIEAGGHHSLWTDAATASLCVDAVRRFLAAQGL
jgi:pimeloyl-ACP methyl ester carboxylesterase